MNNNEELSLLKGKLADCVLKVEKLESDNKALKSSTDYFKLESIKKDDEIKALKLQVNNLIAENKELNKEKEKNNMVNVVLGNLGCSSIAQLDSKIGNIAYELERVICGYSDSEYNIEYTINGIDDSIDKLKSLIEHLALKIVDAEERIKSLEDENYNILIESYLVDAYKLNNSIQDAILAEKRLKYTTYKKDMIDKVREILKNKPNLSYQEVADILINEGFISYISKTSIKKIVKDNDIYKEESKRGRKVKIV